MTDVELLEKHRGGSDEAFADLVRRHLGWVYGVARRRLRDAHLAEDVAQAVFVLLHRKMPRFPADGAMMNWLHRAAWYASEVAARNEKRRLHRETEAAMVQNQPNSEWNELAPMLDELIHRLGQTDREAVLLRYYHDMTFAQVAAQIGSTEEAARKRVDRAVEKLREMAAKKGVQISASAFVAGLLAEAHLSAPIGLVAAATTAATAGAGSALTVSSGSIASGALLMMATQKIVIGIGAAVAAALLMVGGTVWIFSAPASSPVASSMSQVEPAPPPQAEPAPPVQFTTATGDTVTFGTFISSNNWVPATNQSGLTKVGAGTLVLSPRGVERLSPFTDIRWRGDTTEVQVQNLWYELVALNDQPASKIVEFARNADPRDWQKRIAEDLVDLMTKMGQPTGATVKLDLKLLDPGGSPVTQLTLPEVPMTHENRQMVWEKRQTAQPVR